ncbi:hypothetical protein JCM11641_008341 [Rhodosporidiobolus odoratus]
MPTRPTEGTRGVRNGGPSDINKKKNDLRRVYGMSKPLEPLFDKEHNPTWRERFREWEAKVRALVQESSGRRTPYNEWTDENQGLGRFKAVCLDQRKNFETMVKDTKNLKQIWDATHRAGRLREASPARLASLSSRSSAGSSVAESASAPARHNPRQRKAVLTDLSSVSRPLFRVNAAIKEPLKKDKAPPPEEFLRRMERATQYSQGTESKGSGAMSIAGSANSNLGSRNHSVPSLACTPSPPSHPSLLDDPDDYNYAYLAPISPVLLPERPNPRLNPGPEVMWSDHPESSTTSDHALAKAHRRITRRAAERYGTTPEEFQAGRSFR